MDRLVDHRKCQCEAPGCEEHWMPAEAGARSLRCTPCKTGIHADRPHQVLHVKEASR